MNEREIAACMRELAENSGGEADLPDPALIWWKAQLLAQRDARSRAASPLFIAEWASIVASGAAGVALVIANWAAVHDALLRSAAFAPWVFSGVILTALTLRLVFGE